jgi:hypothetical protein
MYKSQIEKINKDIKRTGRAIISLGCSFVQGQGAVNDELYTDYEWKYERLGVPLSLDHLSDDELDKILKKYPSVTKSTFTGKLDFTFMEYKNAFVNVLATKYFEGSYASINLGIRGCGNRGSIKDLYFYPEILWNEIKEYIILYVPSGLERFDFVNDGWNDHAHWKCMWPHYKDLEEGPRKTLWKGYSDHLWSHKFEIIEQISHVQELLLWCNNKNVRLIITPGFDNRYNKLYFEEKLNENIGRTMEGDIVEKNNRFDKTEAKKLLNLFPWENMFEPDGYPTFIDLVMAQEFPKTWNKENFFNYLGKGTPNGWVTSCAHPSAKGHDLFAKKIFEYITRS